MNENFEVNNKLFSSGGVMGRLHYFINSVLLSTLAMVLLAPLFFLYTISPAFSLIGGLVAFIFVIPFAYLSIINMNKRIRDIRGSTRYEFIVNTALYLACSFPLFSIIFSFYLLFKEGAVTGNGTSPFTTFTHAYQEYNTAKNGSYDESPETPVTSAKNTSHTETLSENEIQSIRDKFKKDAA